MSFRQAHILKPEKTLTIPRHLVFFDTETSQDRLDKDTVSQKFKLGWAVYYRRADGRHNENYNWQFLKTPNSFWEMIFSIKLNKEKLWVIARNIVFDFTVLDGWTFLKEQGYKVKFFYNNGCTTIISVYKKGSTIVFLDSMNWFVESIEKTGERIGIPKMKIDFDKCSYEELKTYCRRDVLIELENFKLFIEFLDSQRIARLCYTRGSTAMAAYLLRHYRNKIYIHNNFKAIQLEREAYKGGRVECFFLGEKTGQEFYMLDVNSLYPYVMKVNKYPVKYLSSLYDIGIEQLSRYVKNYSVVSKVLIETQDPAYCIRRNRAIFPIGRFEASLCTPEIVYALEHNHIKEVINTVLYEQDNIFESYVDTFYGLRRKYAEAKNPEYVEICKKMLNSLYGKFGQKAETWRKIGDAPNEPDRVELGFVYGNSKATKIQYLLGEVFILESYSESFDSFPAISAHVTAFGRLYLYKIMQIAGNGNYFYCDTDSLIVNKQGLDNLNSMLSNSELGKLKLVSAGTKLTLRGLKDYEFAGKKVVKGIRKNALQIAENVYQQEQWSSFKGLMREAQTDNYTVKTIIKQLNREYLKGKVLSNGLIIPLSLSEF